MRNLKFRITYQHKDDKRVSYIYIALGELIPEWGDKWYEIGKDQFTGLHDKNGVEIYEGDILACWFSAPWDNEVPVLENGIVTMDDPFYGCFNYKSVSDNTCHLYELGECKIIGNIYSNPELL